MEKITGTMYDLSLITNVDDLTEEDYQMWQRVNNYETNPIPSELLNHYQEQVKISKKPFKRQFSRIYYTKITWLSSLR